MFRTWLNICDFGLVFHSSCIHLRVGGGEGGEGKGDSRREEYIAPVRVEERYRDLRPKSKLAIVLRPGDWILYPIS